MRGKLRNGSRKRKLDQDGKRYLHTVGTVGESGSGPVYNKDPVRPKRKIKQKITFNLKKVYQQKRKSNVDFLK